MHETLYEFCIRTERSELLEQWDARRNGTVTPQTVSYGSKRKVWWQCGKDHEWQSPVYSRTGGAGCPVCAGNRVLPGFNDLATQYPELAKQWHREKNGDLTPDRVLIGSHKKVWWVCSQGHEWQAVIKSRTGGCGCPVCTNRRLIPGENDLASVAPALARQWHPDKNGSLTPRDAMPGTRRKVWWQCGKGHEWQATVASRTGNGTGCPICSGKVVIPGENDLASSFPELAEQWDGVRNGRITPETVSAYSNRKVWWRCPLGHSWQAVIAARVSSQCGCPYCAGRKVLAGFNDLAALEPEVAAQWHPTLNGDLTAEMVTVGSRKKVWWQCAEGHTWKAVVYSRTGRQKVGCPVCAGRTDRQKMHRYDAILPTAIGGENRL